MTDRDDRAPKTPADFPPTLPPLPKTANDLPMDFHVAAELFNRGDYYEAHELLEALWVGAAEPLRSLYQGILQIGVAVHHLRGGNRRGALRLLESGARLLAPLGEIPAGVRCGDLGRVALTLRAELESGSWETQLPPGGMLPRIEFAD